MLGNGLTQMGTHSRVKVAAIWKHSKPCLLRKTFCQVVYSVLT